MSSPTTPSLDPISTIVDGTKYTLEPCNGKDGTTTGVIVIYHDIDSEEHTGSYYIPMHVAT